MLEKLAAAKNLTKVTVDDLVAAGFINGKQKVKILGNGALEKNLTVKAAAFSESAKSKIEAAGGKAEVV